MTPRWWTITVCPKCGSNDIEDVDTGTCNECGFGPVENAVNVTEIAPVVEALRYIVGEDVAGYEPHRAAEDVALDLLTQLGPES